MARVDKELEAHVYPATQEDVEAPHCCKVANRNMRLDMLATHVGKLPDSLVPQAAMLVRTLSLDNQVGIGPVRGHLETLRSLSRTAHVRRGPNTALTSPCESCTQ